MFTRTRASVDSILSTLTKTLDQLQSLQEERVAQANAKAEEADRLMKEAMADHEEAGRAVRVAARIKELLA